MDTSVYTVSDSQQHPHVSVNAKGSDGVMFCRLELNLLRGNRIREHGDHKIAPLQI